MGSSPAPLLRVRANISAQWLIGRFVRVLHSKSDLINCAGVRRRTLFLPFVKPFKVFDEQYFEFSSQNKEI
ncbi:hypothetical protein QE629_07365, partial [Streptococcus suis]